MIGVGIDTNARNGANINGVNTSGASMNGGSVMHGSIATRRPMATTLRRQHTRPALDITAERDHPVLPARTMPFVAR